MTGRERKRQLQQCLDIIRRAAKVIEQKYVEQGLALSRIEKQRLYQPDYPTFKNFCERVLGMSSQNVYRAIRVAETGKKVSALTHVTLSKTAALLVSPLSSQQQKAIVLSPNFEQLTTRQLEERVKQLKVRDSGDHRDRDTGWRAAPKSTGKRAKQPTMPGVLLGDCLDRLKEIRSSSVQLIWTSPPYADARGWD